LLETMNACVYSNNVDKAYGLLGVMDPVLAWGVKPDYASDVVTVYTNVAVTHILVYKNLEILRDPTQCGRIDMPSWVPDWTWKGQSRELTR
jgi:hypothetical protein